MIVESYELADVRFRAVKERVVQGDLAPIDSVEAQTILQDRFVQLRQAEVGLVNARLMLSNYLWDVNDTPLEIPETVVPSDFDTTQRILGDPVLDTLLARARENHPELRKLNLKIRQLEVEERFRRDLLKPTIRADYNLLSTAPVRTEAVDMAFLRNNYKFGAYFSFPLFLRKDGASCSRPSSSRSRTALNASRPAARSKRHPGGVQRTQDHRGPAGVQQADGGQLPPPPRRRTAKVRQRAKAPCSSSTPATPSTSRRRSSSFPCAASTKSKRPNCSGPPGCRAGKGWSRGDGRTGGKKTGRGTRRLAGMREGRVERERGWGTGLGRIGFKPYPTDIGIKFVKATFRNEAGWVGSSTIPKAAAISIGRV
jgi:hypothetical protein